MTTTTEKLARYETAQETLGMMVAMRAHWIFDEQDRPAPDLGKIAQWEREQDQYENEDLALTFDDTQGIERVISTYAPVVKAHMATAL